MSASIVLLESKMPSVPSALLAPFVSKPFLRHQAAVFFSVCTERIIFRLIIGHKKAVKQITLAEVPDDANTISSHVPFKIKINNNQSLKLKARTPLNVNEDSIRNELCSYYSICFPSGCRYIVLLESLH